MAIRAKIESKETASEGHVLFKVKAKAHFSVGDIMLYHDEFKKKVSIEGSLYQCLHQKCFVTKNITNSIYRVNELIQENQKAKNIRRDSRIN